VWGSGHYPAAYQPTIDAGDQDEAPSAMALRWSIRLVVKSMFG
jgi:hypothetical protein